MPLMTCTNIRPPKQHPPDLRGVLFHDRPVLASTAKGWKPRQWFSAAETSESRWRSPTTVMTGSSAGLVTWVTLLGFSRSRVS